MRAYGKKVPFFTDDVLVLLLLRHTFTLKLHSNFRMFTYVWIFIGEKGILKNVILFLIFNFIYNFFLP